MSTTNLETTKIAFKEGARALASLSKEDIFISGSTYSYDGGGCC